MKAYKVEVLVIDFDRIGQRGVWEAIENARYPNRCISPHVMEIIERDIGEWTDAHPLNHGDTMRNAYAGLFGES